MSNSQPPAAPAAPITAEEIALLRDALSKATPGEWTVEFESSDQTTSGKDMATVYSGRSDRFHGLNLLGRLFDLGPQGERDLSAAVEAHNLAPKLLAALDAAEQRADATETELATIHRTLGRGDGHGSLHATADCVISGIVTLKERVAEAEKRADAAERVNAKVCADANTAEENALDLHEKLKAAEAKAVEFAWATVKAYGNAVAFDKGLIFLPHYSDRKAFEAAEYLESKGLLRRTDKCEWQRVEGGK